MRDIPLSIDERCKIDAVRNLTHFLPAQIADIIEIVDKPGPDGIRRVAAGKEVHLVPWDMVSGLEVQVSLEDLGAKDAAQGRDSSPRVTFNVGDLGLDDDAPRSVHL